MSSGLIEQTGTLCTFTDIGTVTASSTGSTITTSGSTNTKGSYTQLVASTTRDTDYLILGYDNSPASGTGFYLDLAVGAGGSEQVILSNLYVSDVGNTAPTYIPFSIPAGSRVAARAQSTSATDSLHLNVLCGSGDYNFRPYYVADTYGANTGSTQGTAVDPGGTINTKGTYSQITATTNRDHTGLMFALDRQGHAALAAVMLMDIAIGAGGSEQVIVPNLQIIAASTGNPSPYYSAVLPIAIPAGTRLAVRAQSTANTVTTRTFGITMYGFS